MSEISKGELSKCCNKEVIRTPKLAGYEPYCTKCSRSCEVIQTDNHSTPLYIHDCPKCTFIKTGKDRYGTQADIYICGNCITFRYSNGPSDNRSICFNKDEPEFEWFIERTKFEYGILKSHQQEG